MKPTFQSDDGAVKLFLGDCRDVLLALAGQINHVITDPPYSERTHAGHDASANGHAGCGNDGADRKSLGYSFLTPRACFELAELLSKVCPGWIVWMTDHVLAPSISNSLESAGRYVFAPLPYYAPGSRVRLSGDGPSSWTDWIIASRTAKQSRWGTLPGGYIKGQGPTWNDKAITGGKPSALMSLMVSDYSREGETVCDPFMGAGSTGLGCIRTGRKFVGIETDPATFEIARCRIEVELSGFNFRRPHVQAELQPA